MAKRPIGHDSPVYYIARTVPSYRVPALQRLNERLGGRLVVGHGSVPGGSSLTTIAGTLGDSVDNLPLKNYWLGGELIHIQNFAPVFTRQDRPAVILAEESPRSISLPLLIFTARLLDIPVVLWGHFSSNDRPFSIQHWQDRYRVMLARSACACACYTEEIAALLRPYIEPHRLFAATNTLDTEQLSLLYDDLADEGRTAVKRRLGLSPDALVVSFLGRLIPDKGTMRLLDVFRKLRGSRTARLLVIGDGPDRKKLERRIAMEGLDEVGLLGTIADPKSSAPYLFASDVMLLPGYVGLAINHAFALGLPVVTHRSPGPMRYHSPEISYLKPGENGILTDHGDIDGMARAILDIAANRERYSEAALNTARTELRLERMVDGLEAAIRFAEENC